MAKKKAQVVFLCQECGQDSPKWMGKCPSCGAWNSMLEEKVWEEGKKEGGRSGIATGNAPLSLKEVEASPDQRFNLPDDEFARVLGGGIVPGSVVLFGGEPGVGKSTLMLQLVLELEDQNSLYVSGEESERQIRMRADRVGKVHEKVKVFGETHLEELMERLEKDRPELLVVDSVQTLYSSRSDSVPGSLTQIRDCTMDLIGFAKRTGTPVFLIGHINKEGGLAGPKALEHMVDTVLQFEGDRDHTHRLLRTLKNRFGSTNELGIYRMKGEGLEAVKDPSEVLITETDESLSGVAIASSMEGVRPLMVEVQALVSSAVYGTPQRTTTGIDIRRTNMLLAVLEKRCGFRLGEKDVFLNITGGVRVDDMALDLALVAAVLSSSEDRALPGGLCFAGEVGLSGEIRPVPRMEQRIQEAGRLGYERIIGSKYGNAPEEATPIEFKRLGKVEELYRELFG
ncbi:MAG: DNA repair protein RadA [Flavobacteriales bacterium]